MKAKIVSYRRGRHTQYNNQMIIETEKTDKIDDLIGKKVVYKTKNGIIEGKITGKHGNKNRLRVLFEKGMPGQSLGKEVEIK